ncbi:hypothetical protein [Marinococcus luteus]|uniref:hypothetical protein n=1 Tax=Marinococcus luteus TaxID=1122204 RepID=UPI002ACC9C6D|nr:hypothetical protein [Marinococcus luteus]MDZ5782393.1 hypothetical protein [Marinococcus luteus]
MTKKRVIDFSKDLTDIQTSTSKVSNNMNKVDQDLEEQAAQLKDLEQRLSEMDPYFISKSNDFPKEPLKLYSNQYFFEQSEEIQKRVEKEVHSNFDLLPKLTKLDYIVATIIGAIASLADILFVKIPKDVTYLGKYTQKGGGLTERLRSIGVNEDGQLNDFLSKIEKKSKVSFDASTKNGFNNYEREVSGFYPKTHRLMSLGHDPFFGLLFGLLDIVNGRITFIDEKGAIHLIPIDKFQDSSLKDMLFAPLLWMSHILSDICTPMGIPAPGWGLTQLLQFGEFGEKDRTLADISRYMYLKGYDLRHFISMGIVPGIVEICTRIYYKLTLEKDDPFTLSYSKDLNDIQNKARLQKLLFTAHAVATGGNALKIVTTQGNPAAFNYPQLIAFTKQSIQMSQIVTRDKKTEKIIRNREKINEEWKNI